jgi:hypothetical protein
MNYSTDAVAQKSSRRGTHLQDLDSSVDEFGWFEFQSLEFAISVLLLPAEKYDSRSVIL